MALRFVHLRADFPNYTFWADDHAKFSDEGWYANAAMNSVLLGHWYVPGDWAPAVVVPAWPALLTAEFHITGVSAVAARATEAGFACMALLLVIFIVRRPVSWNAAIAIALLMALNAADYIYSRVAILEKPFEFTILLCIALALGLKRDQLVHAVILGCTIVLMVLTKTTGVFLLPAVLYPVWFRYRHDWRQAVRPMLVVFVTVAVLMALERIVFADHHVADARAFFANSEPHVSLFGSTRKAVRLVYRGTWIDPILWPMACLALLASALPALRGLWRNVLWGVSALWILGYSLFIVYHYDGPPRYFTVMLAPVVMLVVMFIRELFAQKRMALARALVAVCAISSIWNLWHIQRYVLHPEYTMANATDQIRTIIDAHPEAPRFIIGHASNQAELFTAIPSIDDSLGAYSQAQKLQLYNPGWLLIWSDELPGSYQDVATTRTMVPMADIHVMDDKVRNRLELFELLPK